MTAPREARSNRMKEDTMLIERRRRSVGLGSGRVAVALSSAALAVALLGVIPLGSAGGTAVELARGSMIESPSANPKASRGPRGPRGRRGARGPQGIPGAQGERGLQGERGPQGDGGSQGQRGAQGERGPAGTAIAARVRSLREATTSDPFQTTTWPLTGNIWTQRSGETDLLFGEIEVRLPSACEPQDQYGAYAYVNVLIDGEFVGSAYVGFYQGSANRTQRIGLSFYPLAGLMAPESDQAHVVSARVTDSCKGADQNFTFKSLRLDIVSVS